MQSGGENIVMVDQLLSGDSSHGASWLLGRGAKSTTKRGPPLKPPADFMNEMKTSLREEVRHEMEEEMNKKMETNMTFMMKHLARLNPTLNIDVDSITSLFANSSPPNNLSSEETNEDDHDGKDDK
ncbi:uncharacterized protein [Euphorbia lathyris]|uniref:uncharacterized protein n=1 Tax=Euphorbia lathyris TaxID=212925 RepID=UPI0033138D4C